MEVVPMDETMELYGDYDEYEITLYSTQMSWMSFVKKSGTVIWIMALYSTPVTEKPIWR